LPAFSDELKKIASDLMTPAVVSDSAAVTGPPATPFTRRKGYKKLEPVIEKEAAVNLSKLIRRSKTLSKRVSKVPEKLSIKTYEKLPGPAKDMLHQVVQNPADWSTAPSTLARLAKVFGLG
jgi:hypothetical protein